VSRAAGRLRARRRLDEPFAIVGRHVLRTMVPSDEALLLITMLSGNTGVEHESKNVRGFALVPYHG
jgi:hypothetical protein